jgi:cAMP-dependent protein kinase regulator
MSAEQEQLASCEAYVKQHNIQALVKDAIVQLCLHKPDNPSQFLAQYFNKIHVSLRVFETFFCSSY